MQYIQYAGLCLTMTSELTLYLMYTSAEVQCATNYYGGGLSVHLRVFWVLSMFKTYLWF